jgi:hypothetical protein
MAFLHESFTILGVTGSVLIGIGALVVNFRGKLANAFKKQEAERSVCCQDQKAEKEEEEEEREMREEENERRKELDQCLELAAKTPNNNHLDDDQQHCERITLLQHSSQRIVAEEDSSYNAEQPQRLKLIGRVGENKISPENVTRAFRGGDSSFWLEKKRVEMIMSAVRDENICHESPTYLTEPNYGSNALKIEMIGDPRKSETSSKCATVEKTPLLMDEG